MPKNRGVRRHEKPLSVKMLDSKVKPNYSPNQPRDSKGRFVTYKSVFWLMLACYILALSFIVFLVVLLN